MDPATRQLVEAIHQSSSKCVLALTGGGTTAAAMLLGVPGGSRTILEVTVPYGEGALAEFLGRRPDSFCSTVAARDMARRAYEHARWLAPGETVIGVGCTASLATDRPKRGDHRFFIACQSAERGVCHSLTLTKGARDRESEEALLDAALLNLLADAAGVPDRLALPLVPGEELHVEPMAESSDLVRFLLGELPTVCIAVDGQISTQAPGPAVLVPGAFNPVHAGHHALLAAAARLTGNAAAFELSITNVDKLALSADVVRQRLDQFAWKSPVWLTRASRFVEKAELFPGARFVIGADTAVRLVASRYYEDSEEQLAQALGRIRALGCSFLVAGRCDAQGRFWALENLAIPEHWRDLFTGIPEQEFRADLSSTELRARANP
jgi:hypothetical protein